MNYTLCPSWSCNVKYYLFYLKIFLNVKQCFYNLFVLNRFPRYGWQEVVIRLTEGRGKRTINCNDVNERTPLHLAAQEGHDDLVEFFLKRGARIERYIVLKLLLRSY